MESWTTGNGLTEAGKRHTFDYVDYSKGYTNLNGRQVTVSENHPTWRNFHSYGKCFGDLGNEFSTTKRYVSTPIIGDWEGIHITGDEPVGFLNQRNWARYIGPILPLAPSQFVWPPYANSSRNELAKLGSIAIARCAPTNPVADVTTFIGETVKEGLPHAIGESFKKLRGMSPAAALRALGDEHLNLQFGWLPFVNDIKDIVHAVDHAHELIAQYERDSGRVVRRRYSFPPSDVSAFSTFRSNTGPWTAIGNSVLADENIVVTGKVVREERIFKQIWFSGGFTYYIPPDNVGRLVTTDDVANKIILGKKLLGARLTPTALWNLAPWSWLVDWFSNASEVLQNFDAWMIDSQVLCYAYIMEHTLSTYTYTHIGNHSFHDASVRAPQVTLVSETKTRQRATPYGFGLTWDGLSNLQKSILGALGLTRWRGR